MVARDKPHIAVEHTPKSAATPRDVIATDGRGSAAAPREAIMTEGRGNASYFFPFGGVFQTGIAFAADQIDVCSGFRQYADNFSTSGMMDRL